MKSHVSKRIRDFNRKKKDTGISEWRNKWYVNEKKIYVISEWIKDTRSMKENNKNMWFLNEDISEFWNKENTWFLKERR